MKRLLPLPFILAILHSTLLLADSTSAPPKPFAITDLTQAQLNTFAAFRSRHRPDRLHEANVIVGILLDRPAEKDDVEASGPIGPVRPRASRLITRGDLIKLLGNPDATGKEGFSYFLGRHNKIGFIMSASFENGYLTTLYTVALQD
jgi:hypothetical protein